MSKCIMCGKTVASYPGYVTDGKVFICNECAATNSLIRVITRIENAGVSASLKSVFADMVNAEGIIVDRPNESDNSEADVTESSLVNQTGERVELDKDKLDAICSKPQGYIPGCPFLPCEKCHFYYGEIDSCMIGEEGVVPTEEELDKVRKALGEEAAHDFFAPLKPVGIMYDIENMSQDDFYSKYVDNPAALDMWHDYHGEQSEFPEGSLVNQTGEINPLPTVEAVPLATVKERINAVYEQCREEWEKSHNKKAVLDLFNKLAEAVSADIGFSIPELGIPYPAYVRSDGKISEVPSSILTGGCSITNEEIEIADDMEHMSEEDFFSKYANNPAALQEYVDFNGKPLDFLEV